MSVEEVVLQKLRSLPSEQQREVLDFVEFLEAKTSSPTEEESSAYEDYVSYRNDLAELKAESIRSYDQALLTLSGGALGLSIAFIENLTTRPPSVPVVLVCAWILLTLALFSTLLSFYSSQIAFKKEIEDLDVKHSKTITQNNKASLYHRAIEWLTDHSNKATETLNRLSALFFIVGIIFLVWFSSVNLLQPESEVSPEVAFPSLMCFLL